MQYILGIGITRKEISLSLYDESGQYLADFKDSLESNSTQPGKWWEICLSGIKSVLEKSQIDPSLVTVIGYTGHPDTAVFTDDDGKPLFIIPSEDTLLFSRTLQQNISKQPDYKWFFPPKDYLRFQCNGQAHTDISSISYWELLDENNRKWSIENIKKLNIPHDKLPTLKEPSHIVGVITPEAADLTGLAMGTMVGAGASYIESALFGLGLIHPGDTAILLGKDLSMATVFSNQNLQPSSEYSLSSHVLPGVKVISSSSPMNMNQLKEIYTKYSKHLKNSNIQISTPVKIAVDRGFSESEIQTFANTLQILLELSPVKNPAVYGAALLVGVGGGVYLSIKDCLKKLIKPGKVFNPAG